jgi:hypothetical protein
MVLNDVPYLEQIKMKQYENIFPKRRGLNFGWFLWMFWWTQIDGSWSVGDQKINLNVLELDLLNKILMFTFVNLLYWFNTDCRFIWQNIR